MPVHDGSRSDQDERLGPPGPERSQRNPEQFVRGSQSTARLLCVQSQQLLTESEVLEDEVLPGMESADQPAEEMSERHDRGKNFSGKIRMQLFAKSFILQVYDVLAAQPSNIAGISGFSINSRVARIACSRSLDSTATRHGNICCASRPTSCPWSMIACPDSSGRAASSGSCTIKYRRLRHCTPATNLDFEMSISDLRANSLEHA